MTTPESLIHFTFVFLHLGQSECLFVFQRLRETEQIATCFSRYLWQVTGAATLAHDRIKDVEIKTERVVHVVKHPVTHHQSSTEFSFSEMIMSLCGNICPRACKVVYYYFPATSVAVL